MVHSHLTGRKRPLQGVSWDPKRGNFKVRIHFNGQEKFIGRYDDIEDAGLAYDQAARHINSLIQEVDFGHSTADNKRRRKRSRPLNFPDKCHNDPLVAGRLRILFGPACNSRSNWQAPSGTLVSNAEMVHAGAAAAHAAAAADDCADSACADPSSGTAPGLEDEQQQPHAAAGSPPGSAHSSSSLAASSAVTASADAAGQPSGSQMRTQGLMTSPAAAGAVEPYDADWEELLGLLATNVAEGAAQGLPAAHAAAAAAGGMPLQQLHSQGSIFSDSCDETPEAAPAYGPMQDNNAAAAAMATQLAGPAPLGTGSPAAAGMAAAAALGCAAGLLACVRTPEHVYALSKSALLLVGDARQYLSTLVLQQHPTISPGDALTSWLDVVWYNGVVATTAAASTASCVSMASALAAAKAAPPDASTPNRLVLLLLEKLANLLRNDVLAGWGTAAIAAQYMLVLSVLLQLQQAVAAIKWMVDSGAVPDDLISCRRLLQHHVHAQLAGDMPAGEMLVFSTLLKLVRQL